MAGTEADRGETRVDVDEGVVMVGDMELARVLGSVIVAMADKGALPLVTC